MVSFLGGAYEEEYVVSDGARPDQGAEPLVLGGDIGGTSTRFVVADRHGDVVGRGGAGGGNPVAHPDTAAEAFASALRAAVAGVDAGRVQAAVIGLAGGSALGGEVRARFDAAFAEHGLGCTPLYRSDVEVAFASGTPEVGGSVLVAGTGAVAGVVEDGRLVRVADGHGWLLGDDGSGFWMGREAVRVALRELERGTDDLGPLARAVLAHLGVSADGSGRLELIARCYARPPAELARLAPLVLDRVSDDPAAAELVEVAVDRLLTTLGTVRPDLGRPLVLAGGLLGPDVAVGIRLRAVLADGGGRVWPTRVEEAADGTRGAVRLAVRGLSEPDRNSP